MDRIVVPEQLDHLPPADPAARRSRADLRRINFLMGNAMILRRVLSARLSTTVRRPWRILEAGAGDGSLAVRIWSRLPAPPPGSRMVMLDRLPVVEPASVAALARNGWSPEAPVADIHSWIQECLPDSLDLLYANLFAHHFDAAELSALLALMATRTQSLVLLEPRRSMAGRLASRLLGVIGCNAVTRHDAVRSVGAGFRGSEISCLWPKNPGWTLSEAAAGPFGHSFTADRVIPS